MIRPAHIASADHARELARRRLPRPVFDFVDGGAGSEAALRGNERALESVHLRPQVGEYPGRPASAATTILGMPVDSPVLMAPCGQQAVLRPEGELAAARCAAATGSIMVLSTFSAQPYKRVVEVVGRERAWFQLYMVGGRSGAEMILDRAARAGFRALVVTMDTVVSGNRERDIRNGLRLPIHVNLANAIRYAPTMAAHPGWTIRLLRAGVHLEADIDRDLDRLLAAPEADEPAAVPAGAGAAAKMLERYPLTWDEVRWLRERWTGPLVVKGVLTGESARRAVDSGADGVIVSNHGGRQLDASPPTIVALPEVVDAVAGDAEVLVDGGFRRGSDVVKALALGARGVLIGRPYLWGLAVAGAAGAERIVRLVQQDIVRTLSLVGVDDVHDLDRSHIFPTGRNPP